MADNSGATMTDAERIARLEAVLATLISWLHRELGTHGAGRLLDRLAATPQKKPMTDIPARLAAAGLRVKPLEWEDGDRNGGFFASFPIGFGFDGYCEITQEPYDLASVSFGVLCHEFGSETIGKGPKDQAKAAAQSHYRARIIAALEAVEEKPE